MTTGRRAANRVRSQILDGISDYDEWKSEMAVAAENSRREELLRRSDAKCGTVCLDVPVEWRGKTRDFFPVWSANAVSQAEMLN
jgi:hypothetical protein